MPKGGLFSRAAARAKYKAKKKIILCPSCGSDKVKEGSDFYMCNNPHCLHIWSKRQNKVKQGGNTKNVKSKGNSRKV